MWPFNLLFNNDDDNKEALKEPVITDRLEIKLLLGNKFTILNMNYINFDKIFYIAPSKKEVETLLSVDHTDSIRYDEKYFRCGEFARKLHCATFGKGWACGPLKIQATGDAYAHYIFVFILDDKSIYVVEPQTDLVYTKDFEILRGDFA